MKNVNSFVSFIIDFLDGYERELLTQHLLRMKNYELVKILDKIVETYFIDIYCKNYRFTWGVVTTPVGITVSVYTERTLLHERVLRF